MNNELKYIFKGVMYTILLFACIYIAYYCISNKQQDSNQPQKTIISYDDLMERPDVSAGKILFQNNCLACHHLRGTDEFILEKVVDSGYNKKLLYAWIRNGDSVIKSGNTYCNHLFNEYNKTQMTSFPNLTDNEIDNIVAYIKVEKTFQNLPTP